MNIHELLFHVRERFLSVDILIENLVDFEDEIEDCYQGSQFSGNILMLAVIHDNEDVARFLCDFVNKVNELCRVRVRDGRIYFDGIDSGCSFFGKFKLVELLLRHGADPNIVCDLTPLGVAVQTNSSDMVKLLVDAKADVNIATHPVRMWAKRWNEWHRIVNGLFGFDDEDLTMQNPSPYRSQAELSKHLQLSDKQECLAECVRRQENFLHATSTTEQLATGNQHLCVNKFSKSSLVQILYASAVSTPERTN